MAALRRPTALTVSIVQRWVRRLFHFVEVKHFGILRFVGMVGAIVHVQILDEFTAKTVLGEHAFYYTEVEGVHAGFEVLVVGFFHQHFGGELALTAGVSLLIVINAVCHLITCKHALFGIDDNHIVAALNER